MRCPACGFISFDHLARCKQCGKEFVRGEMPRRDVAITTITAPAALRSAEESDRGLDQPDATKPLGLILGDAQAAIQTGVAVPSGARDLVSLPADPPLPEAGVPDEIRVTATGGIASVDPASLPKAGFWLRSVAFLVDAAVVAALASAGWLLVGAAVLIGGGLSSTPEFAQEWLEWVAATTLSILIVVCYFTVFVAWRGQTPGKMLLGLRILRATGEEVTFAQALIRWMAQGLGALLFGIGFLMVAFSRRKQGLHDKLAGTYVVRVRS